WPGLFLERQGVRLSGPASGQRRDRAVGRVRDGDAIAIQPDRRGVAGEDEGVGLDGVNQGALGIFWSGCTGLRGSKDFSFHWPSSSTNSLRHSTTTGRSTAPACTVILKIAFADF